jgi:long-chain-alcohol oxidase
VTLTVSSQARKALDAICDTFVPGEDGLPSAAELGVPEAILTAVGDNPSQAGREQFAGLLEAWNTQLGGSEQSPFSSGSRVERERTLLAWADAPEVGSRAAFQALRKGILLTYYSLPWAGEGPNPVDEALGYPGPLGPAQDPSPKTIAPPCWRQPGSTSSWSRRAATTARRTSTAASCPATRGST